MRFHVGPLLVTVKLSTHPLYDDAGDELLGLCDFNKRLVLLSPVCPAKQRPAVIFHELRHAWCFYCGRPNGDEADADHYALMTDSILCDLERQGGRAALIALGKPDAAVKSLADVSNTRLIACSVCDQRIAPGSVVVSSRKTDTKTSAPVVDLAFYCPQCDHVQQWSEFSNGSGRPTGAWAGEARFLRGAESLAFQEAHPEQVSYAPAT